VYTDFVRRHFVPLFFVFLSAIIVDQLNAQNIRMTSVAAAQDFRSGVEAFNNGLFNKAVLYLEKSLSEEPGNAQVSDWLARTYYRSGFDSNALSIWDNLIATGRASALIQNQVATIRARRGLGKELAGQTRYVMAHTIRGKHEKYDVFFRPTSITPEPDGNFYVASFASSEVVVLDANGGIVRKVRPGFEGFDQPFDVLDPGNGYIYVSNYGTDQIIRCTPEGGSVKKFGGTGVGAGQLLGPEYLASDGKGYIYVTDAGNARVTKYDYDGNYVLSFGERAGSFGGLSAPSGIVVYDNKVFVADHDNKDIVVFDLNGNYLTTLGQGALNGPEGLAIYDDKGDLLVTDSNRVLLYNVDSDAATVLADLSGTARHLIKTVRDSNGDLLSADFNSSDVFVLTQYGSMYAGLAVRIERVYADKFPQVQLEVNVQTRLGDPFTGLDASNFVVTEHGNPVASPQIVFTGMSANANISILVDRSAAMANHRSDIRSGVSSILNALKGHGKARIVTAEATPVVESGPNAPESEAVQAAASNGSYGESWRFDLGLRLAASELIPKEGKSAIIFLTRGNLGNSAFKQYSPSQLLQYLKVNGIRLYTIYVDQSANISKELEYLTTASGGQSYYLYRPSGIGGVVGDILSARDGTYLLQYTSETPGNFGQSFIPVEAEVHLFSRSGRDESGYFAPLQY